MPRRKPTSLTPTEALAATPVRLVDVTMASAPNGGGRLTVPLKSPQRLRWLFRLPAGATKAFEFDALGVFVWESVDGHTSVEEIIKRLAARYKLNLREAQVPTLQFLQTLMKKGLVGVPTTPPKTPDR